MTFLDSRIVITTGTKDSSGLCIGAAPKLVRGPGEAIVGARPTAYNPITCRMATRVGHIAAPMAPPQGGTEAASGSRSAAAAASGGSEGCFTTTWKDPIHLDVNWVRSCIYWSWDNYNHINSCSGSDNRWWLSNTGWHEDNHSIAVYTDWSSYCETQTYDNFSNGSFWLPGCNSHTTTGTVYNPNWVEGRPGPSESGNSSTYVWGGCANFLWSGTELW